MSGNTPISFLFITYNRSDLLKQAVHSLRKAVMRTNLQPEYVVADDGSAAEHQLTIDTIGFDRKVVAKINGGLGANQNRGLAACSGKLVFQIQDDWLFVGEPDDLLNAVSILESDSEIGIVQLTEVGSDLSVESRITESGVAYEVFQNDRLPWRRSCGVRPYSDCPHLKSLPFVQEVGPYLEGVPMTEMENEYKMRVARQSRWRVARMKSRQIFVHVGATQSLNPGGRQHTVIGFLRSFSFFGKWMETILRNSWNKFDHISAVVATRWIP